MSTPKVLVVDDDPHIGELLAMHLEHAGFSVTHVADGERGLQRALSNTYDLVILDVRLPGRDGIEICRELRSKEIAAPIMMLTFRGYEIDKILRLELGADDYATKPFSVREVVARAKALVLALGEKPISSTGTTHSRSDRCARSRWNSSGSGADLTISTFIFELMQAPLSRQSERMASRGRR
jgi:DNA-binding response OmpR family regulator